MKIAIIGTGISGLTCAHHLYKKGHDISVFEANKYIGGHTNTVTLERPDGPLQVDTGFIVFNKKTYPNFLQLIESLGVNYQPTLMSFSVSCEKTGLEYNGTTIDKLFAQRRNLLSPRFYQLISGIVQFNKKAKAFLVEGDETTTLGDFFKLTKTKDAVIEYYLAPMIAAVWSTDPKDVWNFPARFILRFFENHGFLEVNERPQWYVIKNGSKSYVEKLIAPLRDRIFTNRAVQQVIRHKNHVLIKDHKGVVELFEHVIMATHSDTALKLIDQPSPEETEILGAMTYTKNPTYLHTDNSFLPKTKRAWAAWNYSLPKNRSQGSTVTYNMNILQSLNTDQEYNVTLNPHRSFKPGTVLKEIMYTHPLFTQRAVKKQIRWPEINGVQRTFYCGAYWRNGFHEDGVWSALRVIKLLEGINVTEKRDLYGSSLAQSNLA